MFFFFVFFVVYSDFFFFFFFSSRRRHTRWTGDWSSDMCSSDLHHAAHRSAFGKLLVDQPLMSNVLADLCVESEAATVTALRLARAYDSPDETAFRRIATAVAKYWVCKRGPAHAAEALECLGGNGYVEESGLPRIYREAPLNSIWEGSGNVTSLDVLRALDRTGGAADALLAELDAAAGANTALD